MDRRVGRWLLWWVHCYDRCVERMVVTAVLRGYIVMIGALLLQH